MFMKEIERELSQIEPENRSCVLLFSGGIDSTVLLFMLKRMGFTINLLTINYGDRNPKETEACEALAKIAKPASFFEVELDFMRESITLYQQNGNDMMRDIIKELPTFYIPARNMIFLSIAAYYAEFLNSRFIFTGHVKEDVSLLPDVSDVFVQRLNELLKYGTYAGKKGKLKVMLPFSNISKDELVEFAVKYEVPLEYTWSCHELVDNHCGRCRGCMDRKRFMDNYERIK